MVIGIHRSIGTQIEVVINDMVESILKRTGENLLCKIHGNELGLCGQIRLVVRHEQDTWRMIFIRSRWDLASKLFWWLILGYTDKKQIRRVLG